MFLQKWSQNDAKRAEMIQKWFQNDPKMMPDDPEAPKREPGLPKRESGPPKWEPGGINRLQDVIRHSLYEKVDFSDPIRHPIRHRAGCCGPFQRASSHSSHGIILTPYTLFLSATPQNGGSWGHACAFQIRICPFFQQPKQNSYAPKNTLDI